MIKFAAYKNSDIVQRVSAADIEASGDYQEKYRNNLFCNEIGCNARIELAHRMNYPYFKTWPNSKHTPDCFYAFEKDPMKASMHAEQTLTTAISAEHKRKALEYSNRKRKEDEGEIAPTPHTTGTSRINHPHTETGGVRLVPSVDPDAADVTESNREARISIRKCENISITDVGKMVNVFGRVIHATTSDSSVRFFFDTKGGSSVSILFYNRFRDSFSQENSWVEQIAQFIISGKIANLPVNCISVCEQRGDGFDVQVFDNLSIWLNEKSINVFVRDFIAT